MSGGRHRPLVVMAGLRADHPHRHGTRESRARPGGQILRGGRSKSAMANGRRYTAQYRLIASQPARSCLHPERPQDLPRRISRRLIPDESVSTEITSCPCSVAERGTLRSGSSPFSVTSSVSPGAILSKARRVLTNVIGQISRVISIWRVTSCIADTIPFYSICPVAVAKQPSDFIYRASITTRKVLKWLKIRLTPLSLG
jgi:hypothetical protein